MLSLLLFMAGCALSVAIFNVAVHWSLRAPKVAERTTPGELGLKYSEIQIQSLNGKQLFGWFIPAQGQKPAPALAILHGWGGNAETMLPLALPLHQAGYALLLFDARSHGRSDSASFSSMPRFAEDLDHVLYWLKWQPGVDATRIGVIGHSVGAAAALLAASRRDDLAAVVSIAAFAHPEAVMRRLLASRHVPYVPFGWYILHYVQHVIGYRFDDIAPLNTLPNVRCPVLLVHGDKDEMVPLADARALYARRGGGADRLLVVNGSHDSYEDLERQLGELIEFLDAVLSPRKMLKSGHSARSL